MSNDTSIVFHYIYEISLYIGTDTKNAIKPVKIIRVIEDSDYHNNFFPILEASIMFKNSDIPKIYNNQTQTFYKIIRRKMKYQINNTKDNNKQLELLSQDTDIDDLFIPIYEEDDFPKNLRESDFDKEKINSKNQSDYTESAYQTTVSVIRVTLYSQNALISNKDLFNAVFKDADVSTALAFIIDQSSCKKAIVDVPDDTISFDHIILLPYNLRNSIWSLQYRYGIYKDGLVAFFDYDYLYILRKYGKSHEYESGDKPFTKVYITDYPDNTDLIATVVEGKDSISYTLTTSVIRNDSRNMLAELDGAQLLITNINLANNSLESPGENFTKFNNNAIIIDKHETGNKQSGKKISIEYDELNNITNIASYSRETTPYEHIIFELNNIDAKSVKPNKIFDVSFKDTIKNNNYADYYSPIRVKTIYEPINDVSTEMNTKSLITLLRLK